MADELMSRQTAESALNEIIETYVAEKSYTGNFAAGVVCDIRDNVIAELPSIDAVEVPKDNVDDMSRAIIGLGMFRLSFCLNVRETDAQGEPVFRCEECPFEDKKTRKCAVKMFLSKNATEEQRHKFLPIV